MRRKPVMKTTHFTCFIAAVLQCTLAQTVVGRYAGGFATQYALHPDGDIVYIASGNFGISVVDITNVPNSAAPGTATVLRHTITGIDARAATIDADTLYIVGSAGILYKYDISTKTSPVKIGESAPNAKGPANALAILPGGIRIYTCHDGGISEYDVTGSTPTAQGTVVNIQRCFDISLDSARTRLFALVQDSSSVDYLDMYPIGTMGQLMSVASYNKLSAKTVSLTVSSDGGTCFITTSSRSVIMMRCNETNGAQQSLVTTYPGIVGVGYHEAVDRVFATSTDGKLAWYQAIPFTSFTPEGEEAIGGSGSLGLGVHNDYVYACMGAYGFVMVDVSLIRPPPTLAPLTPVPDTPFPDTLAPDTPFPDTPFPDTPFPDTAVPVTPSPPTEAPDTGSPSTEVPATSVPLTALPATLVPETSSPSTRSPVVPSTGEPTQAPETEAPVMHVVKQRDAINTAGSVAAVTSVAAAGAAAGAATRLVVVSQGCLLNGKQKLPRALHPTQMEVWGSETAGMVIGNFAIIAGFTALCFVVLQVASRWGLAVLPKLLKNLDTQGLLRFPSAPLFVFQLLYQGTTLGSIHLLAQPPHTGGFLVGAVSMCVCIAVPLYVFRVMTRDVPWTGVYMPETDCGQVRALFLGPGEWVSTTPMNHWINRYGSVVRTYRQEAAWFSFIEFSASLAISGIQAAETDTYTGCGHKKVFTAIIFFIMLGLEAVVWPHARPRDNVMDAMAHGVQGAAMLLMSVGYYEGTTVHWTFDVASELLFLSVVVLLAKVVVDLCSEGYIFFSGRRQFLQDAMFIGKETLLEPTVPRFRTSLIEDSALSVELTILTPRRRVSLPVALPPLPRRPTPLRAQSLSFSSSPLCRNGLL